jgi:acyl-CoA synthetase (AMP-forming)/AMP-acid ligase II
MNHLADGLAGRDPEQPLWITTDPACPTVTAGMLGALLRNVDVEPWRGKRIALGEMAEHELLAYLVLLDGVVESILLLPPEEGDEALRERLAQARIDVVIGGADHPLRTHLRAARTDRAQLGTNSLRADRQTVWLLPTSGTTGTPKLVPHQFSRLTRHMKRAPSGRSWTWGGLYSVRRFAGLQVVLQAWVAGASLVLAEAPDDVATTIGRLAAANCKALSATPSMWRKLAMTPGFERLALEQATLGGEIVDAPVLALIRAAFPTARLTHIYASTEAGVGFSVHDGLPGFPTDYLDRSPLGVQLRIDDEQRLWLAPRDGSGDWIDSGDLVRIDGDRVFFLGRANGSINVGGNKVMPEEVEAVVREVPDVALVQVRARRSGILGSLVEAAVRPREGCTLDARLKREITAHCSAKLAPFKVPAFVVELEDVKLNASGKVSRKTEGQTS